MKLKLQNWKSAWFDSHISDRFFQEMSRVEKGMVKDLTTSAQWMEQVMIEVGQLAQAMIRLEDQETPEPQIRQALDKGLRLSALCLQLVTTLDGLDRELLKSGQRQFASPPVAGSKGDFHAPAQQDPPPPPRQAPPPPPQAHPQPGTGMPPHLLRQMKPSAHPEEPAQAQLAKSAEGPSPMAGEAMEAPAPQGRPPWLGAPDEEEQQVMPQPPVQTRQEGHAGFPEINPIMLSSSGDSEARKSRMHDTILSLSRQGLSRAEIEAVTGEPRHVIEAVIDNSRPRRAAASP